MKPDLPPGWEPAKAKTARDMLRRVRKAGGGIRLQEAHMYPELLRLRAAGWTYREMALYCKAAGGPGTESRFRQVIRWGNERVRPKTHNEELEPPIQKMLQWNIAAFEEFFLKFSPHPYFPKHARTWVAAFLRERNLMLNVPPRHAKSEFFMIWLPTWLICRDRNVQILMI